MTKLIFCFDGTCNDPADVGDFFNDGSISNILKLHALFGGIMSPPNTKNPETPEQRSFYYSGIGTRGSWLRQKINAAFSPPSADMEDIISEAKEDLEKNFHDGDEIFIFGFSRGAAIARMFASKIGDNYQVKFLGVFDTVAATKGSLDLRKGTFPASGVVFENGTMGKHIESAVHLVSIDEKRLVFQPTLFNHDKRISEIWFAGVHSDIGGSYWFDGLSDITLEFMCKRAKKAGLTILAPSELDYALLKDDDDDTNYICHDDININPIFYGVLHEQHRSKMVAMATLAPRKVRVNVDDKESSEHVPIIHHTVCDRFNKVAGYRPYALRDARYRVMEENGIEGEVKKGIAMLNGK
ncbi:Peptidoglycan binding domain protein [uncultured Candidatus Thioglobus sp.]|nr:Peptidoglycan binding domain protein [uncultured Candidatus Thioglobus sp.]